MHYMHCLVLNCVLSHLQEGMVLGTEDSAVRIVDCCSQLCSVFPEASVLEAGLHEACWGGRSLRLGHRTPLLERTDVVWEFLHTVIKWGHPMLLSLLQAAVLFLSLSQSVKQPVFPGHEHHVVWSFSNCEHEWNKPCYKVPTQVFCYVIWSKYMMSGYIF